MFEVYTGARPGRPRLLLLLSAGLLAGTLALAWGQVRSAHALGPERRIGDTPLHVRLPKGWRVDPQNPQRFILPVERVHRQAVFLRSIHVDYFRLPAFQPVGELLQQPELSPTGQLVGRRAAKLGPYPALELQEVGVVLAGRQPVQAATVTRLTCLPRGQVIRVVYRALADFGQADESIFDDFCRTLRIEDPTLDQPAETYLTRAAVALPLERDWTVVGTDFEQVPGVFIGGSGAAGPDWSMGVLRTWLGTGRTPRDLLADLAAELWLQWDPQVQELQRPDGVTISVVRDDGRGAEEPRIVSAWLVVAEPARAALLLVYAAREGADAADAVAKRIATAVELGQPAGAPQLAAAEQAGAALASDLRKEGAAPRWGREPVTTRYEARGRDEVVLVQRAAENRDPEAGYRGLIVRRTGRREERIDWQIDGQAETYSWTADFLRGELPVRVMERRRRASGPVERQVFVAEQRQQRFAFEPGGAFVPPPVESVAKGWIARGPTDAALIENSSLVGPGTHRVLLRRLPPDGPLPRVLVQVDFWPLGAIEAYDDDRAEPQYEIYPSARYQRVATPDGDGAPPFGGPRGRAAERSGSRRRP